MPRDKDHFEQPELDPLFASLAESTFSSSLTIKATTPEGLNPAQQEFNRCMRALERARSQHDREKERLDRELQLFREEVLPALERMNRAERDLVLATAQAATTIKLTSGRRTWLTDLIGAKTEELLSDPVGLNADDIERLETVLEDLEPELPEEERRAMAREDFEAMRNFMEGLAHRAGVKLDLSGINPDTEPEEIDRLLRERLAAARFPGRETESQAAVPPRRTRKRSKAAQERERFAREAEEARSRDLRSLYKQLAKVLHPDLETDPALKLHKESWMKRLTTAHASGDLRDMLAIEMEWLGEETGNLARASEEKLRTYAQVLREQLAELRGQTRTLRHHPAYQPLSRFRVPLTARLAREAARELADEADHLTAWAATVSTGGVAARRLLNGWADAHAANISR